MLKIILAVLLCFNILLNAEIIENKVVKNAQGTGIGLSREDAVNNAIIEALGQLNGVIIGKKTFVDSTTINSTNGNVAEYVYNSQINKITKGKVDSYLITDVIELGDGRYEAIVEITKTKVSKEYKTPGLDYKKRRSIVIIPSNTTLDSFLVLDEYKSSIIVNINLSQELLNSVTQTRKFNVLDREENKAFFNEKKVLKSSDSQENEILKLGQVIGADYLLTTSIKDFNISKGKSSKIVANMNDNFTASITIQYKVLTMATRQIKFSNTKTFEIIPSGNNGKQIYYDVLKQVSNSITNELLENIYPLIIVDVNGEDVILNQGNLSKNAKYEVFKLGNEIIDSYTRESLGKTEIKVGVIEIVRVLPKISVAKVVEGKARKGDIARSIYSEMEEKSFSDTVGRESDVKRTNGGGVVLPFD